MPAALAGTYTSADSGAVWRIAGETVEVSGPLSNGAAWPVNGLDGDTVEITTPGPWIQTTQLARLVRDTAGKIAALEVSTGRIKKMRFGRTA